MKNRILRIIPGLASVLLITTQSLYSGLARDPEKIILQTARTVIVPGQLYSYGKNSPQSLYISDQTALIPYPHDHIEGSHFFAELGFTHFPSKNHIFPECRKPARIEIHQTGKNSPYSRIKKADIEILYRAANDPDRDFAFPVPEVIEALSVDFSNTKQVLHLSIDREPQSPVYPLNMYVIILKLIVRDVYSGPNSNIAIEKLVYIDQPCQPLGSGR